MPREALNVEADMHDPSTQCTTAQLAWLDLLKDLAGFFTAELKLLTAVSTSEELAAAYKESLQLEMWKSSVKEMRTVLAEVRPAAGRARAPLLACLCTCGWISCFCWNQLESGAREAVGDAC